jgi:hypothetical protein
MQDEDERVPLHYLAAHPRISREVNPEQIILLPEPGNENYYINDLI